MKTFTFEEIMAKLRGDSTAAVVDEPVVVVADVEPEVAASTVEDIEAEDAVIEIDFPALVAERDGRIAELEAANEELLSKNQALRGQLEAHLQTPTPVEDDSFDGETDAKGVKGFERIDNYIASIRALSA